MEIFDIAGDFFDIAGDSIPELTRRIGPFEGPIKELFRCIGPSEGPINGFIGTHDFALIDAHWRPWSHRCPR